jgi:hypothetical protein
MSANLLKILSLVAGEYGEVDVRFPRKSPSASQETRNDAVWPGAQLVFYVVEDSEGSARRRTQGTAFGQTIAQFLNCP